MITGHFILLPIKSLSRLDWYELLGFQPYSLVIGFIGLFLLLLSWKILSAAGRHWICLVSLVAMVLFPLCQNLAPTKVLLCYPSAEEVAEVAISEPLNLEAPKLREEVYIVSNGEPDLVHRDAERPGRSQSVVGEQLYAFPYVQVINLIGILTSLLLLAINYAACWLRFHKADEIDDVVMRRNFDRAVSLMGNKRFSVRLRTSPNTSVPVAVGLFRKAVILPEIANNWDEEKIRSAICHELAHIYRGDLYSQCFGRLSCALFWWNPLAWKLFSQLKRQAEFACDDRVIRATQEPEDYADHLVAITRSYSRRGFSSAEVGMLSSAQLSSRIESILDKGLIRKSVGNRLKIATILFLIAFLFGSLFIFAKIPNHAPVWDQEKKALLADILESIERAERDFPALVYSGLTTKEIWEADASTFTTPISERFRVWLQSGRSVRRPKFRIESESSVRTHRLKWFDGLVFREMLTNGEPTGSYNDVNWERGRLPLIKDSSHYHSYHSRSIFNSGAIKSTIELALSGALYKTGADIKISSLAEQVVLQTSRDGTMETWWFDPSKNYALVAAEYRYVDRIGRLSSHSVKVDRLRSMGNDFWFPEKVSFSQITDGNFIYRGQTQLNELIQVVDGHSSAIFAKTANKPLADFRQVVEEKKKVARKRSPQQKANPKGGPLSGMVVDQFDNGIEGALLEFSFDKFYPKAKTGPDGRWEIPNGPVSTNRKLVRLSHPEYEQDTVFFELENRSGRGFNSLREGTSKIVMMNGVRIFGTVVNSVGQPIPDAALIMGRDRWGANFPFTRSDKDGKYLIANDEQKPRLNERIINIQAKGYKPQFQELPLNIDSDGLEVNFQLSAAQKIRGVVVGEDQKPLQNVLVVADEWKGIRSINFRCYTNKMGEFSWDSPPDGDVLYHERRPCDSRRSSGAFSEAPYRHIAFRVKN